LAGEDRQASAKAGKPLHRASKQTARLICRMNSKTPHLEHSDRAYENFLAGRFAEAVQLQIKVVNALLPQKSSAAVDALKRLSLYFFMLGDFNACTLVLSQAAEIDGNDPDIAGNLGIALSRLQRFGEAIPWLEKALARDKSGANWLDALARCHGKLGQNDAARRCGERALNLKARIAEAAAAHLTLPPLPALPLFDADHPQQHVIAYSLWGDKPRYLDGAVRNAQLAPQRYPGWMCRFYCDDSVPVAALERLRRCGAQVVMRPRPAKFYEGLLWRFEVASDPAIRRFLVRDADSLLSAREKAAVDAWLASDRHFHVMRDFYTHTELILAGMWGGVGGILPPVMELLSNYRGTGVPTRNFDQKLLQMCVWPRIRASVLIHDSWFRLPGTQPFPAGSEGGSGTHVGQNFSAIPAKVKRET
jgi:tetratricopeptide (TPR) repeat protein